MPKKKVEKAEEPKNTTIAKSKKETSNDFTFGGKMTKEERIEAIEAALKPVSTKVDLSFKVETTEYTPTQWVVVMTQEGNIYQEPVPRYFDYLTFVNILASIPDKNINENKIDFEADIFKTSFAVKGLDCEITTSSYDGRRRLNPYAEIFEIKNGTIKVGGNIVFGGTSKGLNKKECKILTEAIVKKLNSYEENIK